MEDVKIHRLRRANKYKKEMDRSFEVIYHNLKRIQEDKVSIRTRTSSYRQTQESSKVESVNLLKHQSTWKRETEKSLSTMKCHLINKLHEVVKSSNGNNDLMRPCIVINTPSSVPCWIDEVKSTTWMKLYQIRRMYTRWSGKADKFEANADTQGKCIALINLSFMIKEPLSSRSHQCLFKDEQF